MSLFPHWDNIEDNSLEQLVVMCRELEVSYFEDATLDELRIIVNYHLNPSDMDLKAKYRDVFLKNRYKRKISFKKSTFRFIFLIFFSYIIFSLVNHIAMPVPYCNSGTNTTDEGENRIKKCRKCPGNSTCVNGSSFCPEDQFLSVLGCRPNYQKKKIKSAIEAANYVSLRDSDCIQLLEPLVFSDFKVLFPDTNISIFEEEPELGLVIETTKEGVVIIRSHNPDYGFVCSILNSIERNYNLFGFSSIILFLVLINKYFIRRLRNYRDEISLKLAREAHKILSTSGKEIYQYDMKVQLRAMYSKIDVVWKYVVRAIENNPHVIVGVKGARGLVYWKWVPGE